MQETQLAANVVKADFHQRIVMAFEPLVGLPVHAFGLTAVAIQDASRPHCLRSAVKHAKAR